MKRQASAHRAGFTLIELAVVLGLIALIVAVAFPHLAPVIAFSNHEGAARHLAGFGRAAIAHCVLMHDRLTIKVDLDKQEYWAVKWVVPEPDDLLKDGGGEEWGSADLINNGRRSSDHAADGEDEESPEEQAAAMRDQFNHLARLATESRARNVRHDRIIDEIGPIFEDYSLETEEDEGEFQEVELPLLLRTRLPDNVVIESMLVGTAKHSGGTVEFEISPLGLPQPVVFYVKDGAGDYYTVTWDAITGGTRLQADRVLPS